MLSYDVESEMKTPLAFSRSPLLLAVLLLACSKTQFAAGGGQGRSGGATPQPQVPEIPATPGTPGGTPGTPDVTSGCTNTDKVTGAHLLFLMDNSGSMEQTDCPGGRATCLGETEREKALLVSFDVLSQVQAKYPFQTSAVSTLSYAQFTPGAVPGFRSKLVGFEIKGQGRGEFQRDIQFLRQPAGDTPFAGAVEQARDLSQSINSMFSNDGKPRVIVVVTDGEPTDRDPAQVLADVKAVRATGLKWITVKVTNGQSKDARTAAHRTLMLNSYENSSRGRTQSNGHWYVPRYANFESYFAELMLFSSASSDQVIEIDTSDKLQKVILEEIIAKEVQCKQG